jgi:hypothetical protein
MSALGQKLTSLKIQFAAFRHGLPVACHKFPVLGVGNSIAIALAFRGHAGHVDAESGNLTVRERFAPDRQHSQPVADFLALSQPSANSPEEGRKSATEWLCSGGTRRRDAALVRASVISR